jgi:DNA-binding NarL/FixJ family response regulator
MLPERRLTTREWEVLKLLADGRSTREIAARLTLSVSTVRVYVGSIVRKLEVADRDAAVELFRQRLEK